MNQSLELQGPHYYIVWLWSSRNDFAERFRESHTIWS